MNNQIDSRAMVAQAQTLLTDIKKINDDFVIKSSAQVVDINHDLQQLAKINQQLEKVETQAINQADAVIIKFLADE